MITNFEFVGITVSGQWTNGKIYPNLGFVGINGRPYATVMNDSNVIDVADTASANWQVSTVIGLIQVYP